MITSYNCKPYQYLWDMQIFAVIHIRKSLNVPCMPQSMWNHCLLWPILAQQAQGTVLCTEPQKQWANHLGWYYSTLIILHEKKFFLKVIPSGIFFSDCNLVCNAVTVGTGASKKAVKGIETWKFTNSIGSDTLSTDTCCKEIETCRFFGCFCFGLKCLRLVNLSFLWPLLSFMCWHINT